LGPGNILTRFASGEPTRSPRSRHVSASSMATFARQLNRFPYAVYYRELPDRIRVLAVSRTSRDPSGWQSRH
jgi:hypothetical protein